MDILAAARVVAGSPHVDTDNDDISQYPVVAPAETGQLRWSVQTYRGH